MERHTYLSIKQQQSFLPIMPRRAYPYLSIKGCGTNYTNYPTQVSIKSRSHKPPQIPGHLESFTNYTTQIPGHLDFPRLACWSSATWGRSNRWGCNVLEEECLHVWLAGHRHIIHLRGCNDTQQSRRICGETQDDGPFLQLHFLYISFL